MEVNVDCQVLQADSNLRFYFEWFDAENVERIGSDLFEATAEVRKNTN